jgi:hypothetical protein
MPAALTINQLEFVLWVALDLSDEAWLQLAAFHDAALQRRQFLFVEVTPRLISEWPDPRSWNRENLSRYRLGRLSAVRHFQRRRSIAIGGAAVLEMEFARAMDVIGNDRVRSAIPLQQAVKTKPPR